MARKRGIRMGASKQLLVLCTIRGTGGDPLAVSAWQLRCLIYLVVHEMMAPSKGKEGSLVKDEITCVGR